MKSGIFNYTLLLNNSEELVSAHHYHQWTLQQTQKLVRNRSTKICWLTIRDKTRVFILIVAQMCSLEMSADMCVEYVCASLQHTLSRQDTSRKWVWCCKIAASFPWPLRGCWPSATVLAHERSWGANGGQEPRRMYFNGVRVWLGFSSTKHANLAPFVWLAVRYNDEQWLAVSSS